MLPPGPPPVLGRTCPATAGGCGVWVGSAVAGNASLTDVGVAVAPADSLAGVVTGVGVARGGVRVGSGDPTGVVTGVGSRAAVWVSRAAGSVSAPASRPASSPGSGVASARRASASTESAPAVPTPLSSPWRRSPLGAPASSSVSAPAVASGELRSHPDRLRSHRVLDQRGVIDPGVPGWLFAIACDEVPLRSLHRLLARLGVIRDAAAASSRSVFVPLGICARLSQSASWPCRRRVSPLRIRVGDPNAPPRLHPIRARAPSSRPGARGSERSRPRLSCFVASHSGSSVDSSLIPLLAGVHRHAVSLAACLLSLPRKHAPGRDNPAGCATGSTLPTGAQRSGSASSPPGSRSVRSFGGSFLPRSSYY
jgi:hypothetical protein